MLRYLIRRLIFSVVVVAGVVTITFGLMQLIPGDPVDAILGTEASPENREALRHELGLDRISFLAADVTSEAFNRPGGWQPEQAAAVALEEADLPLLAAELDALEREHASDFAEGFIAEGPEKLRRRLLQYFSALLGQEDFGPVECNAPWVSAVVEADGMVRPYTITRGRTAPERDDFTLITLLTTVPEPVDAYGRIVARAYAGREDVPVPRRPPPDRASGDAGHPRPVADDRHDRGRSG